MLILLAACAPARFEIGPRPEEPAPGDTDSEVVSDADGDGFGPETDCDDGDPDAFPGAEEVCDGDDDDCDGEIDEEVSATDWIDADGDGFGGEAFSTCDDPVIAEGGDCDDDDAAVHPDAEEACDGVDQDCDGEIDEDVGAVSYPDEDGDGYGAGQPSETCEGVRNGLDCDDGDAAINPEADDLCDRVDDDCDGRVDDDDPDCDGDVDVPAWGGSGADDTLVVTETIALDRAWGVVSIAGNVVTLASAPALDVGDEVLILGSHGSDAAHAAVGRWETAFVTAVADSVVTLDALASTYGETTNADLTGQAVQVVRVWQYEQVVVAAGGVLTANAWNGASGGVLALRVQDTVLVEDGGAIAVDALGYAGGAKGSSSDHDARQGESYAGEGDGDHAGGEGYNEAFGSWAANYGGGGAHITGGGGEHAGGATGGDSWSGTATAPEPGQTYGEADLSLLFFGSGGGGVWNDGTATPDDGGDGGGIVFLAARDVVIEGAGGVTATGGSTTGWSSGSWTYGAGGGAGGSVWVYADRVSLTADAIDASGGFGESSHIRVGGDGGAGRVRVDCSEIDGLACTSRTLAEGVVPDPGYVGSP
ncbi:MAG: putative metal-binding motif-containing protein [Myxococcota bacterium]